MSIADREGEEVLAQLGPSPVLDSFRLDGDIVVVTGASRGLGEAICRGLASAGATVVAVARDGDALQQICEEVYAAGGRAEARVCDITDPEQVDSLAAAVLEEHGRVDVLVNNAGVAFERAFSDMTLAEFRQTIDVNLVGTFLITQAFGRSMITRRAGRIVNIGSVDAVIGTPNLVAYCASKGGVVQMTRALSAEWARFGIRVNCLCPGYFISAINEERLRDPDLQAKVLGRIPMRRFGSAEEFVPSVLYLASRASDFMTGETVVVDGGESAR